MATMGLLPRWKDSGPDYRKVHPLSDTDLEKGELGKGDLGQLSVSGKGIGHEKKERPVLITWGMR